MKQYNPNMVFLTKMDPLTLQAFVYICPDHELGSLFALIPPHVATTWVSYLLHVFRYRPSTQDEVSTASVKSTQCIQSLESKCVSRT